MITGCAVLKIVRIWLSTSLASAANEVLCFNVSLPLSASSTLQGLTSTATLAFAAEQTVNNP